MLIKELLVKSNFVTKPQVNQVFKDFGLETVKISTGRQGGSISYKPTGSIIKGIQAGGSGPMDTGNGDGGTRESLSRVLRALRELGLVQEGSDKEVLTANPGTKKAFTVRVSTQQYPRYTRSAGYDSSYTNTWIIYNIAGQ